MGKGKMKLLVIFCIFSFVDCPLLFFNETISVHPSSLFTISIMAPNNNQAINEWATLMAEQLPRIGIGVELFDHTNWEEISQRTYGYPGPFPIPTHAEGGFDLLFMTWNWGLDYNPYDLYHSNQIIPNGENFYQYNNSVMDLAINNYTINSYNLENRLYWAEQIQDILYEDLPSIPILYQTELILHDSELAGWDSHLWSNEYQSMHNWSIYGENDFHYAQSAKSDSFHIYLYDSNFEAQWLNQIYTGLITRATNTNEYISNLAANWFTTDGINYTVELNPLASWADGTPLNTSDVKYSFELYSKPLLYNDWEFFEPLTNVSVTIIDEHNCVLTFQDQIIFPETIIDLPIMPKSIWESISPENQEEQAETWALTNPTKLIGAGPYYLYNYNEINGTIHLKRNDHFEDWFGYSPYFSDVYFDYYFTKNQALSAFNSDQIDSIDSSFSLTYNDVPIWANCTIVKTGIVQEIAINMFHPYLGTGELCPISSPVSAKHIRKAISHMVPRDIIIEEILDGLGEPGVTSWPNIAFDFNDALEPYEYAESNFDLAKFEMQAAGFMIGFNLFPSTPATIIIGLSSGLIIVISITSMIAITYLIRKRR